MAKSFNPYTKLPGYKYLADEYPNGPFCVFDRSKMNDAWYSEPSRHQWLIKKMPDGPTMTTRTFDEAKQKAIVSARSIHSWDHWWK